MSEYIGNRYRIVKLIGRGGMADVYLAYDEILKREVAVKIMKADMADDPLALERFQREAGAVTQLSHPNIVDVYDVGDDKDRHYIVMEYIKGYTLKQLIKKRGPIPYKEAVWMMKQLAGALMEAHRNNVIHRDVKSQNVLIKDDGTIKLSDFGIALANGAMQITKKIPYWDPSIIWHRNFPVANRQACSRTSIPWASSFMNCLQAMCRLKPTIRYRWH